MRRFYGYRTHRPMRLQQLLAVSVVLGRENMAFMDASDPMPFRNTTYDAQSFTLTIMSTNAMAIFQELL